MVGWKCGLCLVFAIIASIVSTCSATNSPDLPYGVKIWTLGEEKLREKCREVSVDEILHSSEIKQAAADSHLALSRFRAKMGFGRAIAAPQVGHSLRLVAMHWSGKPCTLYNPRITHYSPDTFTMWDDCLSFPNVMCCVRRSNSVSVSFLDENGKQVDWPNCPRDLSELLQHEIDHLDGILAVDRAESPQAGVDAIVDRAKWLESKDHFNKCVDFGY